MISTTWKFEIFGEIPQKPAIIIFWHGFMLPVWKLFSNKYAFSVISKSKDGELLAFLLSKWKYGFIRGSSSKDSKLVMQQIVNIAKENYVLITPDGPRGPLYKLKAGAIVASKRTQTPIYLIGVDVNKKYISKKSWDKFCVPLPFARIKIKISEPIIISEIATTEEIDDLILKYEYQLNEMYENLIY